MPKRTFVCRCEDVTLHDIETCLSLGLCSIEEIKRYTGLGTGPCQGKECLAGLARVLVERGLGEPRALQPFTTRPPAEPVTFGSLAALGSGTEGEP